MIETLFLTALAMLSLLVAIGPPWAYSRWKLRLHERATAPAIPVPPAGDAGAAHEIV